MIFGGQTLQKTIVSHERSFKNHTSRPFRKQVRKSSQNDSKKEPKWRPKTIQKVIKKVVGKMMDFWIDFGRQKCKKGRSLSFLGGPFWSILASKIDPTIKHFPDHFFGWFWASILAPFWNRFGYFFALLSERARCVIFEGPIRRNDGFLKGLGSTNRLKIKRKRNRKRNII